MSEKKKYLFSLFLYSSNIKNSQFYFFLSYLQFNFITYSIETELLLLSSHIIVVNILFQVHTLFLLLFFRVCVTFRGCLFSLEDEYWERKPLVCKRIVHYRLDFLLYSLLNIFVALKSYYFRNFSSLLLQTTHLSMSFLDIVLSDIRGKNITLFYCSYDILRMSLGAVM